MKILSAQVSNFASYKHLEFQFSDQGLTLISGPTGAGKSTLCDIIPWILFGVTAKNGSVDEIRSWNTEAPTEGNIVFKYGSFEYYIRRIRGIKSNDLFYGFTTDYSTEGKRGKDLNDTQKRINNILGITSDTYLSGAYYHEFSQTAQFFNTTAKIRRSITEQLADLTLAKNLQEKLSAYNKEIKKEIEQLKYELKCNKQALDTHKNTLASEIKNSNSWAQNRADKRAELIIKSGTFEAEKNYNINKLTISLANINNEQATKIANLEAEIKEMMELIHTEEYFASKENNLNSQKTTLSGTFCESCHTPKNIDKIMLLDKELYGIANDRQRSDRAKISLSVLQSSLTNTKKQTNPYYKLIEQEKQRKNTYLDQEKDLQTEENPHQKSIESLKETTKSSKLLILSNETLILDLSTEQSDIELLSKVTDEFRGIIITRTVAYLEANTNKLLTDHFGAEIRVKFTIADADRLEVEIIKDGNSCGFTQLSKGQRQLLQLTFAVSVMKSVSMHNGVNFNCLFFDEVLSGMDDNIRVKAFDLLNKLALEYESIFVVDHSDAFKSCFTNRIDVTLINGWSEIEKA